jgi:mannose-1-phosphate guanylyltransferase/mannose-6-phosphate isomerase
MIVVIIAGGSGTRLWPLSNPHYPKHLLRLTGDRTLLQQTYARAECISNDVYIVSEKSHAHHITDQLPGFSKSNLLIEPARRGTANCVLFALDVLKKQNKQDDAIAFIHCDHFIKNTDAFALSMKKAADIALANRKIVLCGIKPAYSSTSFGYIEQGDSAGSAYKVKSFKEKPDPETARRYLESGNFLWNAGYFIASAGVFFDEIEKYSSEMRRSAKLLNAVSDTNSGSYTEAYLSLQSAAIDYALIEKDKDLLVIPAEFDWMDIGSFNDLYDVVEKDSSGNYLNGNNIFNLECSNIFVRNEEQKPVAVIGLKDIIVVNTETGILVTSKKDAPKIASIVPKLP